MEIEINSKSRSEVAQDQNVVLNILGIHEVKGFISKKDEREQVKIEKEIQPIEFTDLLEPAVERNSSNNEELEGRKFKKQGQKFYINIEPRKRLKKRNKIISNPIVQDFVINEGENALVSEFEKQMKASASWGFESTDEFFKEEAQQKKD